VLDALKAALALEDDLVRDVLPGGQIRVPDPVGVSGVELVGLWRPAGGLVEPIVEEHVREIEPGSLTRTLAGVERVWRAVQSGVFYPAPSLLNCSGCGYRAACRA
jgi:hypothetical protein